MPPVDTSFYSQWRVRCGIVPLLREDIESPPEFLLQAVWQHQRLLRDELKTADGESLRILHPGFRSVEGGPDFRGAVIQFGEDQPKTGDVEIDLRSSGWRAHKHDTNPAFRKVILHVIWEQEGRAKISSSIAGKKANEKSTEPPPTLALKGCLDAPLGELNLWLGTDPSQVLPENLRGKCSAPLRELHEAGLTALLEDAAKVRLQSKAAQFQARARQAGWDQALWEGLFRALGYKHNVWPMHRLAELRHRWCKPPSDTLAIQARLLGISGLLPTELPRTRSGADHFRRLWDQWWRERDEFSDCILPKTVWRFHGLRPVNQPQRRLALASNWFVNGELSGRIENWCSQELSDRGLATSLLETFQVKPDDFWSWHCTLRSARLKKPQPLLGSTRVTDLAVNVVLPWLWIRATEGKNKNVQHKIEQRYFAWPAAEDNSLLRLARQRLLGRTSPRLLRTAAMQQGLIQIVRDFCERSNALCEHCQFPALVKEWRIVRPDTGTPAA